MKRIILGLVFVSLLVFGASFIPDNPSMAYPPITPIPPTYIEPMWFGIYCKYPGAVPPNEGYIRVKWDETFPSGYVMDTTYPGRVTVFYPSLGFRYYQLSIVENGVSHWWGTTWMPPNGETAEITGYVRLRRIGSVTRVSVTINPVYWYQHCPELFIYLPIVRK